MLAEAFNIFRIIMKKGVAYLIIAALIAAIGYCLFFCKNTLMLDHVSLSVKDYEKSRTFYDETLSVIGYKRVMTIDLPHKHVLTAGYGKNGKPSFWISPMGKADEEIGRARGFHVAFLAPDAESVNRWYKKCLELGATSNGAPGPRPQYHEGYYGAFVIDPNGWRIEAVFHGYKGNK